MIYYALYNGSVYIQVLRYECSSEGVFLARLKHNPSLYIQLPRKCLLRVLGRSGILGLNDHWPLPWPKQPDLI